MAAPPYMKLYVADYLGDTHHLNALEHGAYLLLLMSMWRAGGTLPNDEGQLRRLAKCSTSDWLEVRQTVIPFFVDEGERLTHKRLTREMEHYADISAKRAGAGRAGGNAKANASGLPPKPEPEPKPDSPKGEARGSLVYFEGQVEEAREAGGEALASMATHPGMASIAPLRALMAGENPCDWTLDIIPAIRSAAAWHMNKGGAGSMKTWTAVAKFATENRDQRLAGPGTGNPNGSATSDARTDNLARAYRSTGERPQLHR